MSNFRLVLLDYAKNQLEKPVVKQLLSDMIVVKQQNFERTDPNYVVMDKHDMIGTHALIYDTTDLYNPKLVFALRLTFEERAKQHKLKTPIQDLAPYLEGSCKDAYEKFRSEHPTFVDCNSWFVDPNYSFKNSGLRLSDIGYAMIYLHIKRMGHNHFIGCTNEKYKAHRWIDNIGYFSKNYTFTHPVVPDIHMMIMMEGFNESYIQSIYSEQKHLFDNMLDVSLEGVSYEGISETISSAFIDQDKRHPKLPLELVKAS